MHGGLLFTPTHELKWAFWLFTIKSISMDDPHAFDCHRSLIA